MTSPLLIVFVAQALFSASDVMGRYFMKRLGFHIATFISLWFVVYFLIRTAAMVGQLYALANFQLGRSQTLFGVLGIVIANTVGLLFFKEVLTPLAYTGVALAIVAFLFVGFGKA